MTIISQSFDHYNITYYSGYHYEALIDLFMGSPFIDTPAFVGRIAFVQDGAPIPPNDEYFGAPRLYYPLRRFNDVINILREEKPLWLYLNLDHKVGFIATARREPVGEEEAK
jgi:hypothetical protein